MASKKSNKPKHEVVEVEEHRITRVGVEDPIFPAAEIDFIVLNGDKVAIVIDLQEHELESPEEADELCMKLHTATEKALKKFFRE